MGRNLSAQSLASDRTSIFRLLLCGAESRNAMFYFCHALIHAAARWKEIAPVTAPCPIQFTEHEPELHNGGLELVEGLEEVLHQLQNDNLIPLGGIVL